MDAAVPNDGFVNDGTAMGEDFICFYCDTKRF